MEQTENRRKQVSLYFTETEYAQIKGASDRTHIKMAVLCRKLLMERVVRIEYREPEELAVLERIFDKMDQILNADMEMLRQLRLMGEWTEESRKNIETHVKEMCLIRQELEGRDPHGDH